MVITAMFITIFIENMNDFKLKKLTSIIAIITALFFSATFPLNVDAQNSLPDISQTKIENSEDMAAKINLLEKIGYGPTTQSLQEISSMTINQWIDKQLQAPYDDTKVRNLVDNLDIHQNLFNLYHNYDDNLNESEEGNSDNNIKNPHLLIEQNFVQRTDYALYSENRLREMMVAFWYNHFNIGPYAETNQMIFLNNYETMIRDNALGNFRTLLGKVAHDPAMLSYLDNLLNVKDGSIYMNHHIGVNENYARELLELHTMGVNSGYTQADVIAMAKILTGFHMFCYCSYDEKDFPTLRQLKNYSDLEKYIAQTHRDGHYILDKNYFLFEGDYHDYSDKLLLGHQIKGTGYDELDKALDMIVADPRTGKFISKKLAVYFLSDNPPQSLIDSMAKVFTQTNGDIKTTLKVLLDSPQYRQSLHEHIKYKDMYTYDVSTLKTLTDGQILDYKDLKSLNDKLAYIEASPYSRDTPEGLSIYGKDWLSTNRLAEELRYAKEIVYAPQYSIEKPFKINYNLWTQIAQKPVTNQDQLFDFLASEQWLYR
jgi:uncharacterized protein (DUF1800 family)